MIETLVRRFVRSAVLRMQGYVPGEQPAARKVIKLNTNENPYPPSPRVVAAIRAACDEPLQRYPDPRATAFRMQAAALWGVEPEWILCGNGSDDILTILTRTFIDPGEYLCTPSPTYVLYPTLTDIQGAECRQAPFESDWTLGEAFFELAQGARLVVLANPNSPSGTRLTAEQIRQAASRIPCPILIDEAYADFADENCVRLVRDLENVMVSRTMSKSYGLAAMRFGYLVARPEWIEQCDKVRDSYNCDRLAAAAATAAISDQEWLQENVARVRSTRERMEAALADRGFRVTPSQANFVWCQPPADASAREVFQRLRQRGVLVRYMDFAGHGDGLRISVGDDAQIDALLAVLDQDPVLSAS